LPPELADDPALFPGQNARRDALDDAPGVFEQQTSDDWVNFDARNPVTAACRTLYLVSLAWCEAPAAPLAGVPLPSFDAVAAFLSAAYQVPCKLLPPVPLTGVGTTRSGRQSCRLRAPTSVALQLPAVASKAAA
jgi:hypothetical protein